MGEVHIDLQIDVDLFALILGLPRAVCNPAPQADSTWTFQNQYLMLCDRW